MSAVPGKPSAASARQQTMVVVSGVRACDGYA